MSALVVFPDVVDIAVQHLTDQLAIHEQTATVGSVVPNPRPDELVVVRRTGGTRLNLVADEPNITVECWARRAEDAHDLAQLCRAILHAMRASSVAGVPIYRVTDVGGPVDLPDPTSNKPRYTFTVAIAARGWGSATALYPSLSLFPSPDLNPEVS